MFYKMTFLKNFLKFTGVQTSVMKLFLWILSCYKKAIKICYKKNYFGGNFRSNYRRCSVRTNVLRNFAKFAGKRLCLSLFFNKVAGLRHRRFPVNFAKFLRTSFLENTAGRLLLWFVVNFIKRLTKTFLKNTSLTHNLMNLILRLFILILQKPSFCNKSTSFNQTCLLFLQHRLKKRACK